ncbi:aminotransferase class I/II-fold pyridoxal phosphate-dependent enzyme [Pelagicoccus enzymogenes]|uniref:pyridoxal phosphate-dependent aminotransferase n=1 Tax=Pelagicoccus enzymogenes TaxID=2773457 RepID=UPI00280EF1D7|nr:aminotransferase class I/II-fold pyridoxal phosphate-dependent enzyme [Pelagicoccus enzymogenes]MDQ8196644.1 aminotransferase class I/II-fold pyridoxal phosphate-dependent enzyme [Pelagicoccus enzymogenes]
MPSPADRLSQFSESVIRGMTRLANSCGAINLSQGFPDFDPPEEVLCALEQATRGPYHQYAVTWGAPRFRQALAQKIARNTGLEVDPDQHLVVTCGSTEAMMVAMMTACNPGDKVIVFSPFYENYAADAILSGAEPIYVTLNAPDFGYLRDELVAAFEQKPKAIIVCNPSNPTGKVFTREELSEILDLATQHDAYVITDEPYEHIVYEPHVHTYACSLPGAFERVITCNSLSKTYSITGWRLGYVLASPEVIAQARKVHDFLTVGAAAPLQEAAVAGLELPDSYYEELQALYARKKELFLSYLRRTGLPFTEPQGAYYVMVDISSLGFPNDTEAAKWFARELGVAGVPGSSFFREPEHRFIRFHFAKKEETLIAAGERLLRLADSDWMQRSKR